MLSLALDTCFGPLQLAAGLTQNGTRVTAVSAVSRAEDLPRALDAVLDRISCDVSAIERIVCTVGPGGFSSVRAGLAFAQGLAGGLRRRPQLVAISSLAATWLSAQVRPRPADGVHGAEATPLGDIVIADARRGQIFLERFDGRVGSLDRVQLLSVAQAVEILRAHAQRCLTPADADVSELLASHQAEFGGPDQAFAGPPIVIASSPIAMLTQPPVRNVEPVERLRALYVRAPDAKPYTPVFSGAVPSEPVADV